MKNVVPTPPEVAPEALELAARVRELIEAVVVTDTAPDERQAVAREVAALTDRLRAQRRDPVMTIVTQHENGRIENLTQFASGRLNPQSFELEFGDRPDDEVVARCTLSAAHGGPPGWAHGGVVATLLDDILAVAAMVMGGRGMTAGLNIRYRAGTPYGVPLEIRARLTGQKGRKSYATGEIRANGVVTAEAEAIFVSAELDA